ncbi:hypothetical protein POTOM_048314 [Populus tomentosa]|uniref:Cytochrome c oxidase subunit 5C n=1 Tax=Populus tomentosa TaxID=118781 RepID=A0A8X7YCF6_POPTO|nr:hypothetical protein POTOM_048314 [Populus tomentosa]
MAGGRVAHVTLKGPSVVREICIGFALGLVAGGLWKMHHWNEQRKVRSFYDLLEKASEVFCFVFSAFSHVLILSSGYLAFRL